ncbi:hypothetical protein TrRE_jg5374, partial [Triparma retinervis]
MDSTYASTLPAPGVYTVERSGVLKAYWVSAFAVKSLTLLPHASQDHRWCHLGVTYVSGGEVYYVPCQVSPSPPPKTGAGPDGRDANTRQTETYITVKVGGPPVQITYGSS